MKRHLLAAAPLLLAGCVTPQQWWQPFIDDQPTAERQLRVDSQHCETYAHSAVPTQQYQYVPPPAASSTSGTVTAFGNGAPQTAFFNSQTVPQQNQANVANLINIVAASQNRAAQGSAFSSCMHYKGWVNSIEEARAIRVKHEQNQEAESARVMTLVASIPDLHRWSMTDPQRWELAVTVFGDLMRVPEYRERSTIENLLSVTSIVHDLAPETTIGPAP